MAAAVERHSAVVRAALAPWEAERNYPNFASDPSVCRISTRPRPANGSAAFKAQYDPRDLIRSTHPIPTT